MENKEKLTINEFMQMFIAISYLREEKCINIDYLKNYIKRMFQVDEDILSEIDIIINQMLEEDIVSRVVDYEYLIKINDNYPVMKVLKERFDYFGDINKLYNGFICYIFLEDKEKFQLEDNNINLIKFTKVYKKERTM